MKKLSVILCTSLCLLQIPAMAGHISGGELFYQYIGPGSLPNSDQFRISLRLFRECGISGSAEMPTMVTLGVFRKLSATSYTSYNTLFPVNRASLTQISATPSAYPCISPFPGVCYQVGTFEIIIDLPKEAFGYMISYQTCCRAAGIVNMQGFPIPGGNNFFGDGATYVCNIPGT